VADPDDAPLAADDADVDADAGADANEADDAGAAVPGLPDIELSGAELLSGDLLGGDLGSLLSQAQDMMAAQAAAADQEVEGVAGGGVVRIRATGTGQVLGVTIAPEVVDPDDVPMLEDLVLAALHDVNARLAEIQRAALGPLAGLADLFSSEGDSASDDADDAGDPDQQP
jgi:DNA-binding YbaB/EbfC family protein